MKIAVTGHRPNKLGNEYGHNGPISKAIRAYLRGVATELGCTEVITGMALGVDTIWAVVGLELKVPIRACIPHVGQEIRWSPYNQEIYKKILSGPTVTKVIVCEGGYSPYKMQIRNEYMVNECDVLIAMWDGTSGGTANCVRYAQEHMDNNNILIQNPHHLPI